MTVAIKTVGFCFNGVMYATKEEMQFAKDTFIAERQKAELQAIKAEQDRQTKYLAELAEKIREQLVTAPERHINRRIRKLSKG